MSDASNTLFLRLEGLLQAWGDPSKFVIRRTMDAPTKSGVMGLICCAMGIRRDEAREKIKELKTLTMGVRIDRPGTRWWDYHTAGAKIGLLKAEGGIKYTASTREPETLVSRREYLCDASFLVVLQAEDTTLIRQVADALARPRWPVYLGRKCCPPATPVLGGVESRPDLLGALKSQPWRPRLKKVDQESSNSTRDCLIEWRASATEPAAPPEAEVWHDVPVSFDPPVHEPRLVVREQVTVDIRDPIQHHTPPPSRPRANYQDGEYKKRRHDRLERDHHLCVFCKAPATTVQHVTYRRAGGSEQPEDLRSLCRLCHDAVTMIEYGLGMGLDRINPEEPRWRNEIIVKRDEIIRFRSLETRRRRLSAEEVE